MKVKEESEKIGLKLNIQKTKIMASGPITSWQIDGETMETVADFIFLGFKITADGDCSHEIKRRLLLGRKVRTIKIHFSQCLGTGVRRRREKHASIALEKEIATTPVFLPGKSHGQRSLVGCNL